MCFDLLLQSLFHEAFLRLDLINKDTFVSPILLYASAIANYFNSDFDKNVLAREFNH